MVVPLCTPEIHATTIPSSVCFKATDASLFRAVECNVPNPRPREWLAVSDLQAFADPAAFDLPMPKASVGLFPKSFKIAAWSTGLENK